MKYDIYLMIYQYWSQKYQVLEEVRAALSEFGFDKRQFHYQIT